MAIRKLPLPRRERGGVREINIESPEIPGHNHPHPHPPPEGVKKLIFSRLPGENRGPVSS